MSPVKPIRKRDRDATRARIVDAARDLFVEQGYARTTIADIAVRRRRAADGLLGVRFEGGARPRDPRRVVRVGPDE